jgi:hypothetical protein
MPVGERRRADQHEACRNPIRGAVRWIPPFVLSEGAGPLSFWVVDSSTGDAHRLSVQKGGREPIVVAGTRVEAVRLKMTVPGLPVLFWSAPWWFRASDGTFLRFEMAQGMPGTPKTILELIGEQ